LNISDLYAPIHFDQQLEKTALNYENAPANFTPANQSFSHMVANPMLFSAGGGNVVDPSQARDAAGTAYLGERNNIAATNLATKASFADLLQNAGGNIGAMMAAMTQLQAQHEGSQNSLQGSIGGFL
jgi:hypothetical protein